MACHLETKPVLSSRHDRGHQGLKRDLRNHDSTSLSLVEMKWKETPAVLLPGSWLDGQGASEKTRPEERQASV